MRLNVYFFAGLCFVAGLVSCRRDVGACPEPVEPLYREIARLGQMDSTERAAFMHTDSASLTAMLQYLGADSLTEGELISWSGSMPVKVFTPAVDSVFPSLAPLEQKLGHILGRAADESLDLPVRRYAAVVWGKRRSIVMVDTPCDSVMLIALNHYLGTDYPGYAHWPMYMRLDKTPGRLPYDLAEAMVADRYPYRPGHDATVLSRIVYEGVLALAKIRLVPDGTAAGALGYTEKQFEWLADNEHDIWLRMIDLGLLYDTSSLTADRLVAPAPSTATISPDAPGRIGRYIGYRVICSYMKQHADVTLKEMLAPEFYNNPAVLVEAAYGGN